jgi:hypothetical protein
MGWHLPSVCWAPPWIPTPRIRFGGVLKPEESVIWGDGALPQLFPPGGPTQQLIEEEDPELEYLSSLSKKEKKKLLKYAVPIPRLDSGLLPLGKRAELDPFG